MKPDYLNCSPAFYFSGIHQYVRQIFFLLLNQQTRCDVQSSLPSMPSRVQRREASRLYRTVTFPLPEYE